MNANASNTHAPFLRRFTLTRLKTQEGAILVYPSDLYIKQPKLLKLCDSLDDLESYIETAICHVRAYVSGCSIKWENLVDPSQLNHAVAQYALYSFFAGSRSGSVEANLAIHHKELYDTLIKTLPYKIDSDRDGTPEVTHSSSNYGSIRYGR